MIPIEDLTDVTPAIEDTDEEDEADEGDKEDEIFPKKMIFFSQKSEICQKI